MSSKPIRDYVELVLRLQAQLKGTVASDIQQADQYSSEQWQEIVRHNRTWLEAKSLTAAMDQPIEVNPTTLQRGIELLRLELAAYTGNGSHPTSADTAALSTTDDSRQPSDWETQAKSQCLSMLESLPPDFKPLSSVAVMTEQVADQLDANVTRSYDANDAWLLMAPRPTVSIEDIGALVKQLPSRLFECLATQSQLGTLPDDQAELTTGDLPENVLYAKAMKLLNELDKLEVLAPTTGTPKTEQARLEVSDDGRVVKWKRDADADWEQFTFGKKAGEFVLALYELKEQGKLPAPNPAILQVVKGNTSQNIANVIFPQHKAMTRGLIRKEGSGKDAKWYFAN